MRQLDRTQGEWNKALNHRKSAESCWLASSRGCVVSTCFKYASTPLPQYWEYANATPCAISVQEKAIVFASPAVLSSHIGASTPPLHSPCVSFEVIFCAQLPSVGWVGASFWRARQKHLGLCSQLWRQAYCVLFWKMFCAVPLHENWFFLCLSYEPTNSCGYSVKASPTVPRGVIIVAELLTRLLQNSIPEPYCARSHDITMWRDGHYERHEGKMRWTVWALL